MYYAVKLILLLVLLAFVTSSDYFLLTWGAWLVRFENLPYLWRFPGLLPAYLVRIKSHNTQLLATSAAFTFANLHGLGNAHSQPYLKSLPLSLASASAASSLHSAADIKRPLPQQTATSAPSDGVLKLSSQRRQTLRCRLRTQRELKVNSDKHSDEGQMMATAKFNDAARRWRRVCWWRPSGSTRGPSPWTRLRQIWFNPGFARPQHDTSLSSMLCSVDEENSCIYRVFLDCFGAFSGLSQAIFEVWRKWMAGGRTSCRVLPDYLSSTSVAGRILLSGLQANLEAWRNWMTGAKISCIDCVSLTCFLALNIQASLLQANVEACGVSGRPTWRLFHLPSRTFLPYVGLRVFSLSQAHFEAWRKWMAGGEEALHPPRMTTDCFDQCF